MGTLSNNSKVGDKGKDLILQTSSRVYVQVKDRFYEINFRGDDQDNEKEEVEETPRVLFVEDSSILDDSYPYPGDDYLIIANGEFFRTINGEYEQILVSTQQNSTFNTPITINTLEAPLNITSTKLVKNLNAQYLNSLSSDVFTRKDIEEQISKWTIKELLSDQISNGETIMNLKAGSLTIDTIRVNNLIVENKEEELPNEDNSSDTDFEIINKKTYFSNGVELLSSRTIDKMSSFTEVANDISSIEYYANENYLVGGFSIIDLIIEAYENEYITELPTLLDYVNSLTVCQKLNEDLVWVNYTPTENDFTNDGESAPYQKYKFSPKDSSIYSTYKYGIDSTCLEKIYDRWYNIENYTENIASTYAGTTFECNVGNHTLVAGSIISGKDKGKLLDGLVVGCTENKIRVIISGIDCLFQNKTSFEDFSDWDISPPTEEPYLSIYNAIKLCQEEQQKEKGINISEDLSIGNILFTGSSENIMGNISGTENSIFGTLEGYGLTSEGNCYFVNPGIALVNDDELNYLKLTNKEQSFIGINQTGENFITIENNGNCSIKRDNMYNINNYTSFCSFGPIVVQEDGSATIGTGETQITIDTDGVVKIPKAAILDI